MPNKDGTGPMGQGAGTGRGLRNCLKVGVPLITGIAACLGFGRGRGTGRGLGRGFGRQLNPQDELTQLKQQSTILEKNQEEIKKRIEELEKNKGE